MDEDQVESLRRSTTTLVRILKIMEPEVPTAHDRFKSHPSDIAALRFIAGRPGAQSKALAAHLGIAPTTATSIVDRLVGAGLVARTRPEDNRRAVALSLTPEGQAAFAAVVEEEKQFSRRMLGALPAGRRAAFVESLSVIAETLERNGT